MGKILKDAGINKVALAYRWTKSDSALGTGYGFMVGASQIPQLLETLEAIEAGESDVRTANRAGDIWEQLKKGRNERKLAFHLRLIRREKLEASLTLYHKAEDNAA